MRYEKQILLKEIEKKGHEKLRKSTIAVIGIGALGSNSASLLARAGINLVLVDRDVVELDNLQRQNLFSENDIGKEKALAAEEYLNKINSEINIDSYVADLYYRNINILDKADLILDCTDNLETRFLINEYCLKNKKPWIYSGILGTRGMMLSFNNEYCFNCIFKETTENLETCDTIGVLNSVASLISSIQVTEAIKILLNRNNTKELIVVDVWSNELKKIKVNKNKNCLTCKGNYYYSNGKKGASIVKLCGRNAYQIKGKRIDIDRIKNFLYKGRYSVTTRDFIAFNDGRVILKADSEGKAKIIYHRYFG